MERDRTESEGWTAAQGDPQVAASAGDMPTPGQVLWKIARTIAIFIGLALAIDAALRLIGAA